MSFPLEHVSYFDGIKDSAKGAWGISAAAGVSDGQGLTPPLDPRKGALAP